MDMLLPGPYILDHVIRTGEGRGIGVLNPSWLRLLWVGFGARTRAGDRRHAVIPAKDGMTIPVKEIGKYGSAGDAMPMTSHQAFSRRRVTQGRRLR